jgi:hypothetical protein
MLGGFVWVELFGKSSIAMGSVLIFSSQLRFEKFGYAEVQ